MSPDERLRRVLAELANDPGNPELYREAWALSARVDPELHEREFFIPSLVRGPHTLEQLESVVARAYLIAAKEVVYGMDAEEEGEYGTAQVIVPGSKSVYPHLGALAVIYTERSVWDPDPPVRHTLDTLENKANQIMRWPEESATWIEPINGGALAVYQG